MGKRGCIPDPSSEAGIGMNGMAEVVLGGEEHLGRGLGEAGCWEKLPRGELKQMKGGRPGNAIYP